ncbi:Transposase [Bacteroidales bacterium Barb6]|nr:Transposase [Bacteroidales bacterium Barb6]
MIKDSENREMRYCISDGQEMNTSYFNAPVRGHWGIESHLYRHWDVTLGEDACAEQGKDMQLKISGATGKPALQIIKEQLDKLRLKKHRLNAAYNGEAAINMMT